MLSTSFYTSFIPERIVGIIHKCHNFLLLSDKTIFFFIDFQFVF